MEFTKYKCPVCNEFFKSGDDIVVCPECGAPHHRDCYENMGHCFYEDKHSDSFSFEQISSDSSDSSDAKDSESENTVVCKNCGFENEKATFYCNKCGFPLNEQDRKQNTSDNRQNNPNQTPFGQGMPPFGFGGNSVFFDPMAGINSDEPIAENVTAGEMSKFIGKNTPYFMLVFNRIKKLGASKFNFAAFLFSGVYFLYRKMVLRGIIITLLIIALTVAETFVQLMPEYQTLINTVAEMPNGVQMFYTFSLSSVLSFEQVVFIYLPYMFGLLKGIIMIICGLTANRAYYRHCSKKINLIKQNAKSVNINSELEHSGGVNLALAVCFEAAYVIITYLPLFINF